MMLLMTSACGRNTEKVDSFDFDYNPHGFICCGECVTIIESRESWLSDLDDMVTP